MKFKKLLSFILALAIILTTMPAISLPAEAATATSGTTGDCTWSLNGTVLTISGNGKMGDYDTYTPAPWGTEITNAIIKPGVTHIGKFAFHECTNLTSVIIPKGVKTIGITAFINCSALTGITIPNTVSSIGESAFLNCSALKSIALPNSVTSIKYRVFSGCTALEKVTLGNELETIEESAFEACSSLESVTIPDSVKNIGKRAFYKCNSISEVIIGSGVTEIGDSAFSGCTALTTVNIPDSVINIDAYAFSGCSALKKSVIGNGIKTIGSHAFYNCQLTDITLGENIETIGNYAFYSNDFISITIPDSVASIGYNTFAYCDKMTDLVIGNGVETIGEAAFYKCTALSSITFGSNVKSIGKNAFYECDGLTNIALPDSVTEIGESAFYGCNNVTKLTFGNGLKRIETNAFRNLNMLTTVTVPDSVEYIGLGAFAYCSSLESITIPFVGESRKTEKDINQYPFGYIFGVNNSNGTQQSYYGSGSKTSNSTKYGIPASLKTVTVTGGEILYGAFYNCSMLTTITIPDNISSIGEYAFYGCSNLKKINIPNSVTKIGNGAFTSCSSLQYNIYGTGKYMGNDENPYMMLVGTTSTYITSFEIHKDTKYIKENALYKCTKLTDIAIPEGVVYIGNSAFYGCSSLTNATIPETVQEISVSAFKNCTALTYNVYDNGNYLGNSKNPYMVLVGAVSTDITSCKIHNDTRIILDSAFRDCTNLTDITIPEDVVNIGTYAFRNTGITKIEIPDSVTKIGTYVFADNTKLSSVILSENLEAVENRTFSGCTALDTIDIPDSVTIIGDNAFYNCTALSNITIGDSVKHIGENAFYNCSSLANIEIPNSVTGIGNSAFFGCSKLNSMTLPFIGRAINHKTYTYSYPLGYLFGTTNYTGSIGVKQSYSNNSTDNIVSSTYYIPTNLKTITMTGGELPYGAFYNCSNLKSITFAEGVTEIGESALYNCSSLTTLTIPKSVTYIGPGALSGCGSLQSLTIPFVGKQRNSARNALGYIFGTSSYTGATPTVQKYYGSNSSLTTGTFYIPTSLKSVTVTDADIYDYAFYNCKNLTSITLNDKVTKLGYWLFYNCSSITSLTIPNSVTEINAYAFKNCSKLYSITVPDSVTYIGEDAFSGCSSLTEITLPFIGSRKATESYSSQYPLGYIFGKESYNGGTSVDQSFCNKSYSTGLYTATYCIPTSLKSVTVTGGEILRGNFENCSMLTNITLAEGVTKIGEYPFGGCSKITSLVIPDSVTAIGNSAFTGLTNATNITIGKNVTEIGTSAFSGLKKLTSVTIPDKVTTIGSSAFYNCQGITEVTIGNSVSVIGNLAFYNCLSLTKITIGNSVSVIGDSAFWCCNKLTSINIPDSVTKIGTNAFYNCEALATVYIEDISKWAAIDFGGYDANPFYYAENIYVDGEKFNGSVVIGDDITKIGDYAFYGCDTLTNITIPDSVSKIGIYAFGNTALANVTIPESVNKIGKYAFYKSNIASVNIPVAITEIEYGTFMYCSRLTKVVIPEGVTKIGAEAFYGCTKLITVNIPDSVSSVGDNAFSGCSSLNYNTYGGGKYLGNTNNLYIYFADTTSTEIVSIAVHSGTKFIKNKAFYNCAALTDITISECVLSIGSDAFNGCDALERIEVSAGNKNYCSVNGVLYNKYKTEVIHTPANHKLIFGVNYIYANGSSAYPSVLQKKVKGDSYSATIPNIVGYTADTTSISGTMNSNDVVFNVVYYENVLLDSGKCNNNISWTLYEDGKLVFRGSGAMPNYTSGGAPWTSQKDKIQTVYIDSRITSIGDYAFENCSNLNYVDYGYGITSIGKYAFSGCSSLTSFKLPNAVTSVSEGAFMGCTGIKNVTIPDEITSVGDEAFYGCSNIVKVTLGAGVTKVGDNAFGGCEKLTQVYFRGKPATLGGSAFGNASGKYVYYYSSVSGWNEAVVNNNWNGYFAYPYDLIAKDGFDGTNPYAIKVVDKHNMPLQNAVVKLGSTTVSTNSNGVAYFVKPAGSVKLEISCSNHRNFIDDEFSASATQSMDVIELTDKPSTVQGIRFNGKSIATSVEILNCADEENVKITVSGYSKYTIVRYELYQGDRLISTNKTSETSATFTTKTTAFEEGETVYVKMFTSDGGIVSSALNIDVIKLASISEEQILGELSQIDLSFSLGDMGSYKVPLSFNSTGNEKFYTSIKGRTIRVGINLDVGEIFEKKDEKNAKSAIRKMVENSMKNFAKGKNGLEYNVCGYIEIEYLGNGEYCVKTSYVKIGVAAKFSFSAQASYLGIVGVYFKASLSGEASLDMHITHFAPEEGFTVDDMNFAIENTLNVEGGAYLLWGAGSAGIYGTAKMGFVLGLVPNVEFESVYISGEMGVKWSLLWGLFGGNYKFLSGDIYRWPQAQTFMMRAMSSSLYAAQQDPDSYELNDRSYLEKRSEWLNGEYLQKNIYGNVAPEIVTCGDTTMMVWLDDNSERDVANFQTLYYSIYKNGEWSAPIAVDDDGTFDCEFDAYTDGEKIYVVYTEMSGKNSGIETMSVADEEGIAALVTDVEVSVSVFADGEFGNETTITDNDTCELLPRLAVIDGNITAIWLQSSALGLTADSSENAIYKSSFNTNRWSTPAKFVGNQNSISDITSVVLNGKSYTAYIVDADNSSETKDDQALIICDENGELTQIDTGLIANVEATQIGGKSALLWYNNGKIYMITDSASTPMSLVPDESNVGTNYQIISLSSDETLLSFVMSNGDSGEGTEIYCVYVNESGAVTSPVRLTKTEGYVENYSVTYLNGQLVTVFTETFADISGEEVETVTNLRNTTLDFNTDITLNNVDYSITDAKENAALDMVIDVTNSGTNNICGVRINLYDSSDKLICTSDYDLSLISGKSAKLDIQVVLPSEISKEDYRIEVLPVNVQDSYTEDNSQNVSFAFADISIEAEQKIIGETNYIILSVSNYGNTVSKAVIEIYTEESDTPITSITTADSLAPDMTEQYFVDIGALVGKDEKIIICKVISEFTDPSVLNDSDIVTLFRVDDETLVTDPDVIKQNPIISINTAKYDKYIPEDIAVVIEEGADGLTSIEGLILNSDYTYSNGVVTISKDYLDTLSVGTYDLNFIFDFGYDEPLVRSLSVTVCDSTPITLTGSVSISGNAVVGNTVSADISKVIPTNNKFEYKWIIDGATVGTGNSYLIKPEDYAKSLKLTVTGVQGYEGVFTANVTVTLTKPAAPVAPVISSIESDSFRVAKTTGVEYSIDLVNWQDSNTFSNLLPNQEYTVYARVKATESSFASDASIGTRVRTDKMQNMIYPPVPQIITKTYNTVAFEEDSNLEYRIQNGEWSDNNVFTKLKPNTKYTFYARYKETETSYASIAVSFTVTTEALISISGNVILNGDPQFGGTLTADICDLNCGKENVTYKWYCDGVEIVGATDSSYKVTEADMGKTIKVIVSGNGAYTGTLSSEIKISSFVLGDVNCDNVVDETDAEILRKYIAKWKDISVDAMAADINKDGVINIKDATILRRHIAGWEGYENLLTVA